jgi:hypothetical protein
MAIQKVNYEKRGDQYVPVDGEITYVGCVVSLREMNGYHDSDFYALVWDAESDTFKEVYYDSTRFPQQGHAWVDATEEVKQRYRNYLAEKERKYREEREKEVIAEREKWMHDTGLTEEQFWKLVEAVGETAFREGFYPLLKTHKAGRFKSAFRKSLAEQVMKWVNGESEYRSPLSGKQIDMLYTSRMG